MRAFPTNLVFAIFTLCVATTSATAAEKTSKPLFTHRPMLCVGRNFVAMVPLDRPQPLIVIKIGDKGIEAPQTIPTTGNDEVHRLLCVGSDIELLVRETGSDHFSLLPFKTWPSIQPEPLEDIHSPTGKVGTSPAIDRILNGLGVGQAGDGMRGDWYVQGGYSPGHIYEVHFVETETRYRKDATTIRLVVDLLEETLDRKVTRSVPLIEEEVDAVLD